MKTLPFAVWLWSAVAAAGAPGAPGAPSAPSAVEHIARAEVPAALVPKDGVDAAFRWRDAHGTSYLVVATREASDDDARSSYLTIIHGTCDGGTCRVLRELKDSVEKCGEDVTLDFDPDSVTVTDLDGNGYSEVAFAYRLSCKGDISPDDLKLMLLENGQKYALRGRDRAIIDGKKVGGDAKPDPAFSKAPPAFLAHAKALWKKLRKTTKY